VRPGKVVVSGQGVCRGGRRCPLGHPDRITTAANLAAVLHGQFKQNGETLLLVEATKLCREILKFGGPGDPAREPAKVRLAKVLYAHFEQTGQVELREEAISLARSIAPSTKPSIVKKGKCCAGRSR
jgi:hypothetical protein